MQEKFTLQGITPRVITSSSFDLEVQYFPKHFPGRNRFCVAAPYCW
jgi:hypothetical protein